MGCKSEGSNRESSRLRVGALLLAAGSGSRMGGRPKCLLELDGVPLIRRQIIALSSVGVNQLVVVLGHYGERIESVMRDLPVVVVRNPDPDAGQVSSLRLGLMSLSEKLDCILVALADQPLIDSQDVNDLICAYKKRPQGTEVVQPSVNGLPGNPVMFSAEVQAQILAGPQTMGCRQWQVAHPDSVHHWVSTNQRYRIDVDTPEDIEALAATSGQHLRWPTDLAEPV